MKQQFIIAIDGHAATGKSTIGKLIAKKIDGFFISTGEIYRLLTYWLLEQKVDLTNEKQVIDIVSQLNLTTEAYDKNLIRFLCNNKSIASKYLHSDIISSNVSIVAKIAAVRQKILQFQQDFTNLPKSIIVEGRDIASVIFPDSHIKFFITASARVRATRRLKQYNDTFTSEELDKMEDKIFRRDEIDSKRQEAPTKQVKDAILVDTSNKTIDEVFNQLMQEINDRLF